MIGNKIAEIRKQRGYTLSELAGKTNISKSYLSNLERNLNQNPSLQIIKRIAKVLDVEIEILLETEDDRKKNEHIEEEWVEFVHDLKNLGMEKNELEQYKTLIEFIKWKNQKNDLT